MASCHFVSYCTFLAAITVSGHKEYRAGPQKWLQDGVLYVI